ncbi:MAG: MFS transporter [Actinobacteria bacterium]|nr:MAG: MFS transporter [Actinomycetota bacterium]
MPLPACGFASELPLDDLKGQPACPGVTGGAGTFRPPVRPSVRRQLELFHRSPSFGMLFLAAFGSGLGTWLAFVALTVDVFDRTHSGPWVSALLIADFLPMILIGLVFGPLLDRLSRRWLAVAADLARFGVFCALPFATSAAQIVTLAAAAGFATGFFRPAVYAGLPNLVDDADLPRANSLLQTIENATTTAGPLVGGILVSTSGPDTAYWINAATFVVSALLLLRIPGRLLQARPAQSRGHLRDLRAGFALVRHARPLLTVLVVWNVAMLANAGVNVAEVVLAKVSFHSGDFGFGLLVAAAGLGLAGGSLAAGPLLERRRTREVYGGSLALMAVGTALAAVSPNVWVAAACVVVSGAGNGSTVVCNALLVQRGAPDELRGRAFTVLMSSTAVSLGAGMIAAGLVTNALGARWVWGIAAAVLALAAALGLSLARGVDVAREAPEATPLPVVPGY